ncbi:MAG: CDP-alcohol phosphatidyltransferase family protein [Candidatus Micrarchaeota archaeon]|nr:CDP-alcohol phosphatidyltransferase family protein [Candidatus Micrarchaeota archaeon]
MIYEKSKNRAIQKMRKFIGEKFSELGISPNIWTVLSIFFALIAAFFIFSKNFLLGALFVVISGSIDLIDGAVARKTRKVTRIGAFLDTIADRYNEFIYIFPLFFLTWEPIAFDFKVWIALFLFGSMMTTYVKAAAAEKRVKSELRGGILERAERVILYIIGLIIGAFNISTFQYVIVFLAIVSNISALQRIMKAFE